MTPEQKEIVAKSIAEMTDSMTRTAAERDLQKSIVRRIKEETTVEPKIFRRMARVAFKATFTDEKFENEEFEELYQKILVD